MSGKECYKFYGECLYREDLGNVALVLTITLVSYLSALLIASLMYVDWSSIFILLGIMGAVIRYIISALMVRAERIVI